MPKLSRRNFLVGSATAGLAAAVPASHAAKLPARDAAEYTAGQAAAAKFQAPKLPMPDMALSETFNLGMSPLNEGEVLTATHWGVVHAHVQGGKMTHLTPFEHDYAPSMNLNGVCQTPYAPSRIRYPMVRASYLKDGIASRDKRGEDEWVRVSWDKAFELAAGEIKRVYKDYGPSAVWGSSYGWKSPSQVNCASGLSKRLLNLCGGFIDTINSYSTGAISRILPYVVGKGDPRSTTWDNVLDNSKRIVFWGCDPVVTNDIDWTTTIHNTAGYLRALKDRKAIKTYAVNPIKPDTAEYLDSQWIAPRPGTDCALMLGMIYELIASGKADMKFVKSHTAGYKEFFDYVNGKVDGVKKTPEWAAGKTGVPAKQIRDFARDLADNRTMIMMGWGIQRIQFGEQSHWMGFALASVLGQIGLPGGGIGTNYGYANGGCPVATGPFVPGIMAGVKPVWKTDKPWKGSKQLPIARFADCFLNPGKTIDFNGKKVTYPEVHLVYWSGGNPFAHQPDTNHLARAWKRPDTIIVCDTFWTATARHADIVFPACTTFEHNDITYIGGEYTNDGIVAMQQAIEPQWESKSDYWINSELAKRLGLGEEFTEGRTEMQWIEYLYNRAVKSAKRQGRQLPDFKTFWKKGYIMNPVTAKDRNYVGFADFRKDPKANALNTESGLIQLYSPKIAGYGYDDCLGYPSYLEPTECLNNATAKYPLGFMCCKSRYRLHSQLDGTTCHDFATVQGREPCWINTEDAKARGIVSGDLVKVTNDRGTVMAGAYVTDRIMPGVICVHHGAWYDPQKVNGKNVDVRGNANTLTMDIPTSRLACGNIASSGLVQVEKWQGKRPRVDIFVEPDYIGD